MSIMQITNTTYTQCPQCSTEAYGFDEINEKFGYRRKRRGDVVPYTKCKNCRASEQQEKRVWQCSQRGSNSKRKPSLTTQWLPSSAWARKMHISEEIFVSYLLELGYLAEHPDKEAGIPHMITKKGREHSAITNAAFGKRVLWDYKAFSDVLMYRAGAATHTIHCPYCSREQENLRAMEDLFEVEEKCLHCGKSSKAKEIRTVFDR